TNTIAAPSARSTQCPRRSRLPLHRNIIPRGGSMGRYVWLLVGLFALNTLGVMPGGAQSFDTGILGTITDSSGALVAGAAVTIAQPATGTVRTVQTAANGAYEVRYLLPGVWVVDVR